MTLDARRLGDYAVRCARPNGSSARAIVDVLRARAADGVIDVVVTEEHVAVYLSREPARAQPDTIADWVTRAAEAPCVPSEGRRHVIEVFYDGVDLDAVAQTAGATRDEVVRAHGAQTYTVKMIGFLPGFAYLGDVDPRIVVPRRASPRPRIDAGSVAIAGPYTAVYPFASPGGWNLIARVVSLPDFEMLELGDEVRFVAATP
jgi:UPF0271 protein